MYISSVIKMPKDKKVFVIGMGGLEEELCNEGIQYIGGTVCVTPRFALAHQENNEMMHRIQLITHLNHLIRHLSSPTLQ